MSEQNPTPVVVAVGHDPIDAALAVAAGEAARAGCGLHLVHVVHLLARGPENGASGEVRRSGRGDGCWTPRRTGPADWRPPACRSPASCTSAPWSRRSST